MTCSVFILSQFFPSKVDLFTSLIYLTTQYFDEMANSNQRKLIVGIDFGTTYTGVAWAETRRVSG